MNAIGPPLFLTMPFFCVCVTVLHLMERILLSVPTVLVLWVTWLVLKPRHGDPLRWTGWQVCGEATAVVLSGAWGFLVAMLIQESLLLQELLRVLR